MDNIQAIIAHLTLEEKAALCTGATPWSTTPIERLGVPAITMTDGPHGVRRHKDLNEVIGTSLPATCFPTAACLASTWNPGLLYQQGEALAEEAIALQVDVLLGPGVNMKRSPLGGRNFEYFSEDPYLAGELAASLIQGIQSKGVGTSLKHFAANNQENHRFSISAEMDERTLREIYLPAFEKAVKQAKPWTVMCAYNRLNREFCSENHTLLTEILKDEWGFEGLVVSDWGAVRDRVAALKGGLDLEMPGPQERRVKAVVEAVQSGALDEALLDEAARRILRIACKAQETPKGGGFDQEAHHRLAQAVAAEGMVLLKNNGLLPLKGQQRIAVIGRSAKAAYFQGGGSSHVNPTRLDQPFAELQKHAPGLDLAWAEGYPMEETFRQDLIDEAVRLAQASEAAILFIALPPSKETEGFDREDLNLTPQQVALIQAVAQAQPDTVVVLNNGAPVVMNPWIERVAAVLEAWMMGQAGAGAIAEVLLGEINPSGKLAETFPVKLADTPAYLNWPGEAGKVNYGEGLYIGYRYYEAKEIPVLFPFGYGLSYTTFEYTHPRLAGEAHSFKDSDGLVVLVDVTNTGLRAGQEIVQVYVHDCESTLKRPQKELKGFAKVALQPGETKTVAIPLDFRAFVYYHPKHKQWITETGEFEILIGASSTDIRHTLRVNLESTLHLPSLLDRDSTIREWMADPAGRATFGPFYAQMEAMVRQATGGSSGEDSIEFPIGLDVMEMFNEMPLLSVLMFQAQSLPIPAEDIITALLNAVHSTQN